MAKVRIARVVSERTSTIRIKHQVIETISIEEVPDAPDMTNEPCTSLIREVEQVAATLGISEEEAERIVLGYTHLSWSTRTG